MSKARGKAGQGAVTGAHSMRGRGKSKASRLEAVKGRGKSKASQRQFPARAARDISHWGDARFFFRLPPPSFIIIPSRPKVLTPKWPLKLLNA